MAWKKLQDVLSKSACIETSKREKESLHVFGLTHSQSQRESAIEVFAALKPSAKSRPGYDLNSWC